MRRENEAAPATNGQKSAEPERLVTKGLRGRFIRLIVAVYAVTGLIALALFAVALRGTMERYGQEYAEQYVLRQKGRLLAALRREVALTRKMVDSPLLRAWARNENDAELKSMALAELESYRRQFTDESFFFIIHESGHYYFDDGSPAIDPSKPTQTISVENPRDRWYFSTTEKVRDFALTQVSY